MVFVVLKKFTENCQHVYNKIVEKESSENKNKIHTSEATKEPHPSNTKEKAQIITLRY